MRSQGFVLWLTGLSGAGKSTLAARLHAELEARGMPVEVLDGDEMRRHLTAGLGFSREDRDTNVRRIGYVANLLARHGTVAIAAVIAPFEESRQVVRSGSPCFVEVHVDCSLDELIRRDVKGLYRRALNGEIDQFTGISSPYEAPVAPEVRVNSDRQGVEESEAAILEYLEARGLIPGVPAHRYPLPRREHSARAAAG